MATSSYGDKITREYTHTVSQRLEGLSYVPTLQVLSRSSSRCHTVMSDGSAMHSAWSAANTERTESRQPCHTMDESAQWRSCHQPTTGTADNHNIFSTINIDTAADTIAHGFLCLSHVCLWSSFIMTSAWSLGLAFFLPPAVLSCGYHWKRFTADYKHNSGHIQWRLFQGEVNFFAPTVHKNCLYTAPKISTTTFNRTYVNFLKFEHTFSSGA